MPIYVKVWQASELRKPNCFLNPCFAGISHILVRSISYGAVVALFIQLNCKFSEAYENVFSDQYVIVSTFWQKRYLEVGTVGSLTHLIPCMQDPKLLAALQESRKRQAPYAGAFLVKDEPGTDPSLVSGSESEKNIYDLKGKDLLNCLHEVGTLAQVTRWLEFLV